MSFLPSPHLGYLRSAEWERHVKQPRGYAMSPGGTEPVAFRDGAVTPSGITCNNAWHKPKSGGRGPSLERILKQMLARFGGHEPDAETVVDLLTLLKKGSFLVPVELFGYRDRAICRGSLSNSTRWPHKPSSTWTTPTAKQPATAA